MVVGKELGGKLPQPTPGTAGRNSMPAWSKHSNSDSWGREGSVFPPMMSPAGTAWLAEAYAEGAVSVQV